MERQRISWNNLSSKCCAECGPARGEACSEITRGRRANRNVSNNPGWCKIFTGQSPERKKPFGCAGSISQCCEARFAVVRADVTLFFLFSKVRIWRHRPVPGRGLRSRLKQVRQFLGQHPPAGACEAYALPRTRRNLWL